jgi:hypothetical protein
VTSFEVYVSDVIGRRFERVKNGHIFENWMPIRGWTLIWVLHIYGRYVHILYFHLFFMCFFFSLNWLWHSGSSPADFLYQLCFIKLNLNEIKVVQAQTFVEFKQSYHAAPCCSQPFVLLLDQEDCFCTWIYHLAQT